MICLRSLVLLAVAGCTPTPIRAAGQRAAAVGAVLTASSRRVELEVRADALARQLACPALSDAACRRVSVDAAAGPRAADVELRDELARRHAAVVKLLADADECQRLDDLGCYAADLSAARRELDSLEAAAAALSP